METQKQVKDNGKVIQSMAVLEQTRANSGERYQD